MHDMTDDQLTRLLGTLDRGDEPDDAFADALFARLTASAPTVRRSRGPWLLLAAVLMFTAVAAGAAVGSGVIKLPGLSRNPLPAPSGSPAASQPTSSPSLVATPTPSPTSSPTPSDSAGPRPALAPDDVVSAAVNGLAVRFAAGTDNDKLRSLVAGEQAFVMEGPRSASGYWWYRLSGLGVPLNSGCISELGCPVWSGWVAAADTDGTSWLVSSSLDCPTPPLNVAELGPLTGLQRLACYGIRSITFRGYWPMLPPDAGLGGVCETPNGEPSWLECQNTNYTRLDPQASGSEGSVGYLPLNIDPASGVAMPPRGQWVEVTAHVDDRAAQGCTTPKPPDLDEIAHLLECRSALVVESVRTVDGPY